VLKCHLRGTVTSSSSSQARMASSVGVTTEGSAATATTPSAEEKYNAAVDFKGAHLEVLPLYDEVVPGFVNKVPVLFQFVTGNTLPGDSKRAPFSLCIVLDRSGSMCGGALDCCKKAILQLLNSVGDDDRISLVTYESSSRVEFANIRAGEPGMRAKMAERVREMSTGGGTNLWDGLQNGYRVLAEGTRLFTGGSGEGDEGPCTRVDTEALKLSKHLFVLSDGHVNEGPRQSTESIIAGVEAWEEPTPIISYGIGSGFNERLMTPLGKVHKGGHYFYLHDDASIEKLIARGVRSLTNIAANDVSVSVRPLPGSTAGELWFPDSAIDGWQYSRVRENSVLQWSVELEIRPALTAAAPAADCDGFVDVGSARPASPPTAASGSSGAAEACLAFEWRVHGQFPGLSATSGVVQFRCSTTRRANEEVKTFVEVKRACELRKTACASDDGMVGGAAGGARRQVEEAQKIFKARMAISDRFGFAQEWAATTQALLDNTGLWTSAGAATSAAAKNLGYHTGGGAMQEEDEEEEMDFDLFG